MDLKMRTNQLKHHLDDLKQIYEANNPPENRRDRQFFVMVKEKTIPIYDLLAAWEEEALKVIKERDVNVHPHQITSTRENMELLLMHSFYIDVRRKRYMELNHSIHYIFDQLLRSLS